MNSIYYGLAIVAMLLIVRWYIANDGNGQNDGSVGFLAMSTGKPQEAPAAPRGAKRSFRREA